MKISVICVSDRPTRLPGLYWSLVAQTHTDWELLVLDQSGDQWSMVTKFLPKPDQIVTTDGIQGYQRGKVPNNGDWGQTEKERYAGWATGDILMFPADDAYYVPTALAKFNEQIERGADIVICGWLYDFLDYRPMPPSTAKGHIDVGGFAVRKSVFQRVGWKDKTQTGDYQLVRDILDAGAIPSFEPSVLYVKN